MKHSQGARVRPVQVLRVPEVLAVLVLKVPRVPEVHAVLGVLVRKVPEVRGVPAVLKVPPQLRRLPRRRDVRAGAGPPCRRDAAAGSRASGIADCRCRRRT